MRVSYLCPGKKRAPGAGRRKYRARDDLFRGARPTMLGMLPEKTLARLVCPACRAPLAYRAEREPPDFRCAACKRVYPVRDGIPILLIEEATLED